jgi:hypothetical protein
VLRISDFKFSIALIDRQDEILLTCASRISAFENTPVLLKIERRGDNKIFSRTEKLAGLCDVLSLEFTDLICEDCSPIA